jgi:hypothetical protein
MKPIPGLHLQAGQHSLFKIVPDNFVNERSESRSDRKWINNVDTSSTTWAASRLH